MDSHGGLGLDEFGIFIDHSSCMVIANNENIENAIGITLRRCLCWWSTRSPFTKVSPTIYRSLYA